MGLLVAARLRSSSTDVSKQRTPLPLSALSYMSLRVSSSPAAWHFGEGLHSMPTSAVGGPLPTASRVGRDKQRYGDGGERLVAGCIPVRLKSNHGPDGVEVLMISSRGGRGWVFPKGGWEDDESVQTAAKRETVEEAGVRGILEEPLLGTFFFQSGKNGQLANGRRGGCTAYMYVLHVAEELDVWPESSERTRSWVSLQRALVCCRHQWMKDALNIWIARQGWELQQATVV